MHNVVLLHNQLQSSIQEVPSTAVLCCVLFPCCGSTVGAALNGVISQNTGGPGHCLVLNTMVTLIKKSREVQ